MFLFQCSMHQESLSIANALKCIGEGSMLPSTQTLDVQWVCGCHLQPWGRYGTRLYPPLLEGLIWMPFIDLRKFPLSGFPYHTHNSLSVPVFTAYTLFIHPISHTISIIIFIPIHPFIPLECTLLLYNQETHVFLHLDPSSLPRFSGSTDFSTCNPQVNL